MRSVHTDTPPLLRSARTPAHSANRLARQSNKFPRERGALEEHWSTGAQEQVFQDTPTPTRPDTPTPAGAVYLANPGTLQLPSAAREGPKVQTANQRCLVPSLPNLPPCNLRPTTTCQPQTTERPPVYLSDPPAVYYLEPHPLRHTRAFHFGLLFCVFPTFSLILWLCAFPPENKAATRPAPRLASPRPVLAIALGTWHSEASSSTADQQR